ncbi:hypothetical protein BGW39_011803 [Mortierella sp. 14UC]|nr:hypothetical protein BGW39_011803 [Mortierella sp. 14UC]
MTKTRLRNCTAASMVFAIPELMELVGEHLGQGDLYSCFQVCQFLSQAAMPLLWSTLSTNTQSWIRIFNEYVLEERPRIETEEWVRTIIANHGRHIQHLSVYWNVVLEAVVDRDGACKGLLSLSVISIRLHPDFELPALLKGWPLSTSSMAAGVTFGPQPIWICQNGPQYRNEHERHRHAIGELWHPTRRNHRLASLALPHLQSMNDLSKEVVVNTLSLLPNLKDLNLQYLSLDAETLLRTAPQLERPEGSAITGIFALQQQHPTLRSLSLNTYINVSKHLLGLAHLPNLQDLRFKGVLSEPFGVLVSVALMVPGRHGFRSIKLLQLDDTRMQDIGTLQCWWNNCRLWFGFVCRMCYR